MGYPHTQQPYPNQPYPNQPYPNQPPSYSQVQPPAPTIIHGELDKKQFANQNKNQKMFIQNK